MTLNATPGTERLSKIRRYRRLMYASILLGGVGLIVASYFDAILLGVGVYWAGVIAFIAIWRGTSVQLFDERDVALEHRASQLTLSLVGVVGIVGIPTAIALSELGYFVMPPELAGAIYAYAGTFVVFGVLYLWLRYRP